ncbi:hypothetical protein [Spiroplasma endosymbiont of Monopis laevigella]|uniref:hypothetical protein n=1 Tax=Spiroplasma endosymbiont of Monopis laevigella TaxID=3066312 RepID=UPI003BAF9309
MILAAKQGHIKIVNLLITNGANVNYINKIWQYCFNKGRQKWPFKCSWFINSQWCWH